VVYAALGVVILLLVLQLQVVGGYSPVAAGTALLPWTTVMLVLSSRAGALAGRIGARIPLTVGPLVTATGMLLFLRVGADPSYSSDVLPAGLVCGAGMALTVAPLTATVFETAPDRHAGIASGVNNAIARAASLLAVAVIPAVAGISGADYDNPAAFDDGFRTGMVLAAALVVAGGVLSFAFLRPPRSAADAPRDLVDPVDLVGADGADGERRDP
jgi:MFS family permease